jgi:hypothetical protein
MGNLDLYNLIIIYYKWRFEVITNMLNIDFIDYIDNNYLYNQFIPISKEFTFELTFQELLKNMNLNNGRVFNN